MARPKKQKTFDEMTETELSDFIESMIQQEKDVKEQIKQAKLSHSKAVRKAEDHRKYFVGGAFIGAVDNVLVDKITDADLPFIEKFCKNYARDIAEEIDEYRHPEKYQESEGEPYENY